MRNYKLVAAINFTDIHTKEKYKAGQELNVSEERALELFSSPNHLVKYVSHEEDIDVNSIIAEKDALKTENDTLKDNLDNLTAKYEKLKLQVEKTNNNDDTSDKNKDKSK